MRIRVPSRLGLAFVLAATLVSCGPHGNTANASALVNAEVEILDQDALEELRAGFLEVSGSDRVAFAAGSAQLSAKTRFQLERQALWLTANDNVSIRLRSESASPKGIEERRLALRRAEAVRSFLKDVGVRADQIIGIDIEYGKSDTVSTLIDTFHFGKPSAPTVISGGRERPPTVGSDVSAGVQNPRLLTAVLQETA